MSNLDNIVKKILLDAENEKKDILSDAEQIGEEKRAGSSKKAEEAAKKMIEDAENQSVQTVEKAVSAANLQSRDIKLAAKQKVVDKVLDRVVTALEKMDDETYLEYLKKSLSSLDLSGEDEVRVQKDKLETVKNSDLKYNISDETVDSGFSVLTGNVLYNNDFRSLVDSQKDDLELLIVKSLY